LTLIRRSFNYFCMRFNLSLFRCYAKVLVYCKYHCIIHEIETFVSGKSAVYNKYRNDPRTLLWRTPDLISQISVSIPLFDEKVFFVKITFAYILREIFLVNVVGLLFQIGYTCDMSRNTAEYFSVWKAKLILSVILWTRLTVAYLLWKSNWWLDINLFPVITDISFWRSNFSNSFNMMGNKLIGLYDLTSTVSLFGFGTIIWDILLRDCDGK